MGACSSSSTIGSSIDPDVCKTITHGQGSDIEEPEHYTKSKRGETAVIWKWPMTDFGTEASTRSTLTSSQFTGEADKPSLSSTKRYGVFTDSGSCSRDFSESTSDSTTDFCFDVSSKRATNRYEIGLEMLKAMINEGADPKELVTHGDRTCLMFSVLAGDFDFVKKLVELGVSVTKTNSQGETALGFANELKRYDIARYLRQHGALEE